MERRNPMASREEVLREELGRYHVMLNYYKKNPSRMEPNREYLTKIYTLVSTLDSDLTKLLAQN